MNEYAATRIHQRRPIDQRLSLELWHADREGSANEAVPVQGLDISSGGLGLATSRALQVGEVVKLEIAFNGGGVILPVFSEVVWCRGDGEGARAGLRFLM